MILVATLAFPLGIACWATSRSTPAKSRFARWTRVNVRNLAGVPSVVYGLRLGIFVEAAQRNARARRRSAALRIPAVPLVEHAFDWVSGNNGRNIIASAGWLSGLVLPIVITTMEALRAVPRDPRGVGVGDAMGDDPASRAPGGAPGILTGTVLSLARAPAEERHAILIIGAVTGVDHRRQEHRPRTASGPATGLPAVIFSYARFAGRRLHSTITAATALVPAGPRAADERLRHLARNRYERKW